MEVLKFAKLSNIVSGALDRLHYEDDPCVKYDSEKKVWIYLHSDRDENYTGLLGGQIILFLFFIFFFFFIFGGKY